MINNGKGTQPKVKRNKELAKDYKAGMSMTQLVIKYEITPKRIYDIIKAQGITPNRK